MEIDREIYLRLHGLIHWFSPREDLVDNGSSQADDFNSQASVGSPYLSLGTLEALKLRSIELFGYITLELTEESAHLPDVPSGTNLSIVHFLQTPIAFKKNPPVSLQKCRVLAVLGELETARYCEDPIFERLEQGLSQLWQSYAHVVHPFAVAPGTHFTHIPLNLPFWQIERIVEDCGLEKVRVHSATLFIRTL